MQVRNSCTWATAKTPTFGHCYRPHVSGSRIDCLIPQQAVSRPRLRCWLYHYRNPICACLAPHSCPHRSLLYEHMPSHRQAVSSLPVDGPWTGTAGRVLDPRLRRCLKAKRPQSQHHCRIQPFSKSLIPTSGEGCAISTCIDSASRLAASGEARGSARYQALRLIGSVGLSGEGCARQGPRLRPSTCPSLVPRDDIWGA